MIGSSNAILGSAYDEHTYMLMHGDLTDESVHAIKWDGVTNNGAVIDENLGKFGNTSIKFNGSGQNIQMPSGISRITNTQTFTIEFWLYPLTWDVGVNASSVFGAWYSFQGNILLNVNKSTGIPSLVFTSGGGTNVYLTATTAIATNEWTHVAVVKSADNMSLYVNGIREATTACTTLRYSSQLLYFGYNHDVPNDRFVGNMAELRISDIARWTDDFVPQTSQYTR